ncbi:hypothetical protein BpHYR1_017975 [Brachionus plicatilis]|uniref:Uncharacterized protein n=1 Tax=Brachionus plicatilis TaxID=10195 RepID=A0A3M7R706_BRAPC|nr:hypothetical protein BpHYR1_017975 [Brachionus plicatilis]
MSSNVYYNFKWLLLKHGPPRKDINKYSVDKKNRLIVKKNFLLLRFLYYFFGLRQNLKKDEPNVLELRFWSCVKAGIILY